MWWCYTMRELKIFIRIKQEARLDSSMVIAVEILTWIREIIEAWRSKLKVAANCTWELFTKCAWLKCMQMKFGCKFSRGLCPLWMIGASCFIYQYLHIEREAISSDFGPQLLKLKVTHTYGASFRERIAFQIVRVNSISKYALQECKKSISLGVKGIHLGVLNYWVLRVVFNFVTPIWK